MSSEIEEREIRAGAGSRAVVRMEGATLRELTLGGEAVLDGFGPSEVPTGARGQILAPWPNRVADGRYPWEGSPLQLDLSEPARGHAIHGLVRWEAWEAESVSESKLRLRHSVLPRPGYPFRLDVEAEYQLAASELSVLVTATNSGAGPAPAGLGMHPYLAAGDASADACRLRVPARTVLATDARLIPIGTEPVNGGTDLRDGPLLGDRVLDACYTDLESEDGLVTVDWLRPDGVHVSLWADATTCGYIMVFAPAPNGSGARGSVAIEPMTCAPDAFNNGRGLRILAPGESVRLSWGIRRS